MPSLPVTGGRNPYECTIEGMREVEHQSEREIMKGKLYETLIGTDARLAITISGEELKEFIEDVMADARLRAESEIKAKQSEECIDKEEVKTLLRVCDTHPVEMGQAWQTRPSESRVKKHLPQVGCPGGIKRREVMKKEAIAIMILPLK